MLYFKTKLKGNVSLDRTIFRAKFERESIILAMFEIHANLYLLQLQCFFFFLVCRVGVDWKGRRDFSPFVKKKRKKKKNETHYFHRIKVIAKSCKSWLSFKFITEN